MELRDSWTCSGLRKLLKWIRARTAISKTMLLKTVRVHVLAKRWYWNVHWHMLGYSSLNARFAVDDCGCLATWFCSASSTTVCNIPPLCVLRVIFYIIYLYTWTSTGIRYHIQACVCVCFTQYFFASSRKLAVASWVTLASARGRGRPWVQRSDFSLPLAPSSRGILKQSRKQMVTGSE